MLVAMGLTALLCVGIGVFPAALYSILPYAVSYVPYTAVHVVDQLQLLVFSALAFAVLVRTGIYPPELKSTNIDFDWTYRRLGPAVVAALTRVCGDVLALGKRAGTVAASHLVAVVRSHHGPQGVLARTRPTGSMALWAVILLLAYLLLYYL